MTNKSAIESAARRFVGRRFKHQGRHAYDGFDCTGLVLAVAEDLGLVDTRGVPIRRTDYGNYDSQPIGEDMLRHCRARLLEREGGANAARETGDVLVMRLPKDPTHMALVTRLGGLEAIVHAYAGGHGRVVEHVLDGAWINRIVANFYFPGLES